jgi:hypothetical protein
VNEPTNVTLKRNLILEGFDKNCVDFSITVTLGIDEDQQSYCVLNSENMLFKGDIEVYGVDELDALDYALQTIDIYITNVGTDNIVRWPDGSKVTRVKSNRFEWK